MDRKYVLKALADAGGPVPANISNAKLEALATEKGIPLTDPAGTTEPPVVPTAVIPPVAPAPQAPAADDIEWRVRAGLSREQAIEVASRQREENARK